MAKITRLQTAVGNNGTGATNPGSAALPSTAYQASDIAVVEVTINQATSGEDCFTSWTVPTGWTTVATAIAENLGANLHTVIGVFRRTSAATASSTFSATILSRKAAIRATTYRGADTGATPVVAGAGDISNDVASQPPLPGGSINADDALHHAVALEGVRTLIANTAGFTNLTGVSSSGGGGDTTKVTILGEWTDTPAGASPANLTYNATADLNGYILQIKTATPAAGGPVALAGSATGTSTNGAAALVNRVRFGAGAATGAGATGAATIVNRVRLAAATAVGASVNAAAAIVNRIRFGTGPATGAGATGGADLNIPASGQVLLVGTATGSSTNGAAALPLRRRLIGAAVGVSTNAAAAIVNRVRLALGAAVGVSTNAGALRVRTRMTTAGADGDSTTSGTLRLRIRLAGTAIGYGLNAGNLTGVAPPVAFTLTVDGVERKGVVDYESLYIRERGGVSQASFVIVDRLNSITVPDHAEVIITNKGERRFAGHVAEATPELRGPTRFWRVVCVDYNALLDEDVVPAPAFRSAAESDRERVMWLLSTHGTKGITADTFVQTVIAGMPGGEDGRPEQDFGAKTMREALDYIGRLAGASYHVDFHKELHWYPTATGELLAAPFHLSDAPNGSTLLPHYGLKVPRVVSDYRNAVFVRGAGIYGWVPDPPPAAATRRAGVLRDEAITSQEQLEAAGQAYLDDHAIDTPAECITLGLGLHTGMEIQVTSARHGLAAQPYSIREIVTKIDTKQAPTFTLTLGSPQVGLSDVVGSAVGRADRALDVAGDLAGAEQVTDLTAGGANLIPNSSFENAATAGWTVPSGWTFGAPASAVAGTRVARLDRTAQNGSPLASPAIPIDRARDYWASAWVSIPVLTGTFRAIARSRDNEGVVTADTIIGEWTGPTAGWERVAVRLGPNGAYNRIPWPADTVTVELAFEPMGSVTAIAMVDAVQLEQGALATAYAPAPSELIDGQIVGPEIADAAVGSTQISENAIGTPHLQAGAVDANKIAANAITAGKIAAGVITSTEISAAGIAADLITSGVLRLGGLPDVPDTLIVYDSDGDEIGRWGQDGLLITDPANPNLRVRLRDGVLEFSPDGGTTWTTAIDAEGINADSIKVGTLPGGHNFVPNSGFEIASFSQPGMKVWTSAADWGTTIGTDVNVIKTGTELTMNDVTF